MGQYYHVITEDNSGERKYYNIQTWKFSRTKDYHYYNGLKLMEHSWWENDFCLFMAELLKNEPKKVCWCGDYAEDSECEELGFKSTEVWGKEKYSLAKKTKFTLDKVHYLVNHTKCEFVDLQKYYEKSMEDGWCIFPLSILASLGNGRGGGDYHGTCMEAVGSWAFDLVGFTNDFPVGYEELDVYFKDGRK